MPYIVISVSGMEHSIPLHADESVSFWLRSGTEEVKMIYQQWLSGFSMTF
jgi:hypothetical protein